MNAGRKKKIEDVESVLVFKLIERIEAYKSTWFRIVSNRLEVYVVRSIRIVSIHRVRARILKKKKYEKKAFILSSSKILLIKKNQRIKNW